MTLLSWSEQYLIGNELIDAEHEELFRLINDFHSRWLNAHDRQDIARVFNQLVVYAEMHFRHEETVMEAAGYPRLAEHQQIHASMIDTIFDLHKSLMEESPQLEMKTMKFVKSWLVEHILETDYLFRDFLARHEKSAEADAH